MCVCVCVCDSVHVCVCVHVYDSFQFSFDLISALLNKFLEILQDYCLHTCFAGCHDNSATPHSHASLKDNSQQPHLMLRPSDRSDEARENSSCRLYHSHSVVSAVLNAKQLVFSAERRIGSGGGTPLINKPVPVTLAKEDNSGTPVCVRLTDH